MTTIYSQQPTTKLHILSFVTFDSIVKYFADGNGELNNGEQTTDIRKAAKYKTSKQAEKVNSTLETYYYRTSITDLGDGLYV
jgi:hypothetical protein